MKIKAFVMLLVYIPISSITSYGFTGLGDCLITNDIGIYSYRPRGTNMGIGSGVVGLTGHFSNDHIDNVCTAAYSNINQLRGLSAGEIEKQLISIKVQVTQHAGDDSDKWLLHEVDSEFRSYYGIPGNSYAIVKLDGNTIMEFGSGGWDYRWLSGNKVIKIEYTDLDMKKPEPIEIVKAYLAKHPSTLPAMTLADLRDAAFKTIWIKDEMDRRLWLCDKWSMQLQLKEAEEKDVYREAVKSMNVFLDYREKYYGVKAADEKNLLAGYLAHNNGTGIKAKLTEYKNWWGVNKGKAISL